MREYEIHLDCDKLTALYGHEEEQDGALFYEDPAEIDRIISEEIGGDKVRKAAKRKKVEKPSQ